MKSIPRISDSEWKIMEVVWSDPPVSAQHVSDEVGERERWKPQTVKTLLSRLVKKGALRHESQGNRYLYFPGIAREDAVAAETDSFFERVSRGSLAPVLTHLVETKRPLSAEEIEALRGLLRQEGEGE